MKKSLTVRLPDALVADIEAESRQRQISKSDVVRERLTPSGPSVRYDAPLQVVADLVGSVDGLSWDLSPRPKEYLRKKSC